ncbi:MAG: hypothetical protein IIC73_01965 [Armatimonadetes bacterium]|nr:hypothetical protein [Armatimonadota bacterium]
MTEIDDALARLRGGTLAADAIPVVEEALVALQKTVSNRIFRVLASEAGLSPEIATAAWLEVYAYDRLRRKLTQQARIGQSASKELEPFMAGETDGEETG